MYSLTRDTYIYTPQVPPWFLCHWCLYYFLLQNLAYQLFQQREPVIQRNCRGFLPWPYCRGGSLYRKACHLDINLQSRRRFKKSDHMFKLSMDGFTHMIAIGWMYIKLFNKQTWKKVSRAKRKMVMMMIVVK